MARRQILSQSERESLLALPDDELTLTRMAYFSEHDLALINAHRKPASRFGFAVLLCYLKNVGFAPDKKTPPSDALLKHIANRLKLADGLWSSYINGRETTRREHLTELNRYLGVKAFTNKIQQSCITHLLPMATRTDKGILLAEEMLAYLRQNKVILASYPKQNGLAKALREIGRIERTLFMLDWFRDPALRRRVQAGLNKGEARNALARAVFMHRLGEIRDRKPENQSYRASGLTLLTAAISLWNTVYMERAVDALKRKGMKINAQLLSHLSPLAVFDLQTQVRERWLSAS